MLMHGHHIRSAEHHEVDKGPVHAVLVVGTHELIASCDLKVAREARITDAAYLKDFKKWSAHELSGQKAVVTAD